MSAKHVDEYLRGIEGSKRSTLGALRCTILEIVPDAEQVISKTLVRKLIAARLDE